MNYFELFDLPVKPVADNTYVAKKYVQLQKQYHPDFFTLENEDEREDALEKSAHINKAYKTFANSDNTIEYFLVHHGIITPDEKYELPADFLMEMMDLNETISEGEEERSRALIEQLDEQLYQEVKAILHKESFEKGDFEKLKAYYYKKKYLHRSLDRLAD